MIYFTFSNGWYLLNTLGLSGTWTFNKLKHSNVLFKIKDHKDLYFHDVRNFGTLQFINNMDLLDKKLEKIGFPMLDKKTTFNIFLKIFNKYKTKFSKKYIVEFLMNQEYISGVGNYIKSESLYKCKISPHRLVKDIKSNEIKKLYNSIKEIMNNSYESKGVSKKDFSDIDDNKGEYQDELEVYGKKFDKHGNKVIAEKTRDKRTTYWVKTIQI